MEKDELSRDTLKNSVEVGKNNLNDMKENAIMQMSRRKFLQLAGVTAAALALGRLPGFDMMPTAAAFYQSPGLSKFTQPLRSVGPGAIPVAVPDKNISWDNGNISAPHYTIDINQYQDTLHPELGPTTLWGYNPRNALGVTGIPPQKHLGGIIVAERGIPIQITFQNNLPNKHILPVDPTIMGVEDNHVNRTAVHLHGGMVPWISDGGPFSWFDNAGNYGESVSKNGSPNIYKVMNPALKPGHAEYYYPNNHSARFVWYHDHTIGFTRLNAYSGIASGYIIRDLFERGLRALGLPDFIENGGREIPLIFQDKIFVGADIATADPGWTGVPDPGSLWYPHVYEDRWGSAEGSDPSSLPISVIPEMFGDTMLVNGVVHPFAPVEPRRYRLRILNACQARFLNLQLYEDDGTGRPNLLSKGPDFLVIGTEGGFLTRPVVVPSNQPMKFVDIDKTTVDPANPGGSLLTTPGERWDVIVDFKGFGGKKFILYNDAPAPFPGGDAINDYNNPGTGLNTRTIMRFDVASSITGSNDIPLKITQNTKLALDPLSLIDSFPVPPGNSVVNGAVKLPSGVPVRQLTLNEVFDQNGRLIQMLGTNETVDLPAGFSMDPETMDYPNNYARSYGDTVTENPKVGDKEVWQIANLTMDVHPIHFHLVNVQILAWQPFTGYSNGTPTGLGTARGPDPRELGWKETVKMNPGEVTTVMMKFNLPGVPFKVPKSPRTGGYEYVWHCHILEHEEHDMMRAMVVTPYNLIKNSDFESGKNSWTFYTNGNGKFTVENAGYAGLSAKMAINDPGNNTQLYQTGIKLEPNTRYRLSFAARSTKGNNISVELLKNVSPSTNYGLDQKFDLTSSWKEFSTDFTTSGFPNTVNDGRLKFWLAPFAKPGEVYYIDNVSLEQI